MDMLKKSKTMTKNDKISKKGVAIQCILIAITVLIAVLSGIYLVKGSLAQAWQDFNKNAVNATKESYSALPLKLKEGNSADVLDGKLTSTDSTYRGLVSQDSVLDGKVNRNGEVISTVAFVYDNRLKIDDVFIKDSSAKIPEGFYPIYVAGYEWNGVVAGETLKLILPSSSGESATYDVVVCGKFDYSKLIGSVVSGSNYYNSYRSIIGIVGADLKTLYPNSDKYVYTFTNDSMRNVVTDESNGVTGGTSPSVLQSISEALKNYDFSSVEGIIFKSYTCFIIFIVIMTAIFFVGNRYRVFHYVVYSVITAITMAIYYFGFVKSNSTLFMEKCLSIWFTIFFVIQIVVPILIATIIQSISTFAQRKADEVHNDSPAKYL